jgi:urea transport system substrate-binding protein
MGAAGLMGLLSLSAVDEVDAPPSVVFSLFGAGAGAGWVFDALCDRIAVGAAVTLRAPLDGPQVPPVEIHGRICQVKSGRRIDIAHEQPWRGRVTIRFEPVGAGTRVRLTAGLDERGLEWLMRRRGLALPSAETTHVRLGLLTSKSGPGSLFAAATDGLALLAVDEINADGGVGGRPVELLVGDDATDPDVGVAEARRLVRAACRTILVSTTSATFAAVSDALQGTEVLLVQALMNEGGIDGPLRVQLGERPIDQLLAGVRPVMREAGGRRWFLAGNDYRWPRGVHAVARHVLPQLGGDIVGERFAALGTRDFAPIIEAVSAAGADVILSTFVGADAAAFERQCHAMGLRNRCRTLAPGMDESTLERVGAAAGRGIYGVSGYYEDMANEGNLSLLVRYRAAFGKWAPPLSSLSESVYEAARMWWTAARRVGADEPRRIALEMRRGRFVLPRGTVSFNGGKRLTQQVYLAEAVGSTFCVRGQH